MDDPFGLARFVAAQAPVYDRVCEELRRGRKATHWMWFVFPQRAGLGHSEMARRFAIASRAEAEAYLAHPVLGARLLECSRLVHDASGHAAHAIFGSPDDLKFRSSMTLFAQVAGPGSIFAGNLDRYFDGVADPATLEWMGIRQG